MLRPVRCRAVVQTDSSRKSTTGRAADVPWQVQSHQDLETAAQAGEGRQRPWEICEPSQTVIRAEILV